MSPTKRIDWSFGPGHGPVSGAINAATGAAAVTAIVHDVGGISPWWGLLLGIAAAFASALVVTLGRRVLFTKDRAARYRAGCWFGAGLWSTFELAHRRWTFHIEVRGLAILAVGVVFAAIVGVRLSRLETAHQVDVQERRAFTRRAKTANEWIARILTVCRVAVDIPAVEPWDSGTGFTLQVTLPYDGTTIDTLKRCEKELATAANLPPGCNVEVLATNEGRRTILVRVATVNALFEPQHMPADYSPRSIEDPLSMGIHADRSESTINVRFSCAVLIGQRDSGKSNQLNDVTLGVGRCTDAYLVAIDLSGNGRFPRQWARAWVDGKAPRPAIDLVAVTPEDALLLTAALVQIINGRTPAYADLMHENNVDYLPISPQVPEIILIVDEFGTLPDTVKANIRTIVDTGRGAAVSVVNCALAAKSEYIPRAIVVQSRERAGMRVSDEGELQFLFDRSWSSRFDTSSCPEKGMGWVSTDAAAPAPMKGWRMEPTQVYAASIAIAHLRPALDELSFDLGNTVTVKTRDNDGNKIEITVGNVLSEMWERTKPLMFPAKRGTAAPAVKDWKLAEVMGGATMVAERDDDGPTMDEAAEDMSAKVDAARAARAAADAAYTSRGGDPDPKTAAALAEIEDNLSRTPMPRTRYQQLLREWQPTGATRIADQLKAEGYQTVRVTVQGWLDKDAEAGLVRRDSDGWRWIGVTT